MENLKRKLDTTIHLRGLPAKASNAADAGRSHQLQKSKCFDYFDCFDYFVYTCVEVEPLIHLFYGKSR